MKITIPELCVVALVGVSGSGKSTFGARHFSDSEVLSSDFCRRLVSDDENDQTATDAAFEVLYTIAAKRLECRRLTVIDATNIRPEDRRPIVELAKQHHVFACAIVLDVPPQVCRERNASRPDRDFGSHVIRNQQSALRRSIKGLQREGFRKVYVLRGVDEIADVEIVRERLWTDAATSPGRSTSSVMSTVAMRNWSTSSSSSAGLWMTPANGPTTLSVGSRCSSAISSTVARPPRRCSVS